jgi:hypothetical protein
LELAVPNNVALNSPGTGRLAVGAAVLYSNFDKGIVVHMNLGFNDANRKRRARRRSSGQTNEKIFECEKKRRGAKEE